MSIRRIVHNPICHETKAPLSEIALFGKKLNASLLLEAKVAAAIDALGFERETVAFFSPLERLSRPMAGNFLSFLLYGPLFFQAIGPPLFGLNSPGNPTASPHSPWHSFKSYEILD